jgi:hypothetical protein
LGKIVLTKINNDNTNKRIIEKFFVNFEIMKVGTIANVAGAIVFIIICVKSDVPCIYEVANQQIMHNPHKVFFVIFSSFLSLII